MNNYLVFYIEDCVENKTKLKNLSIVFKKILHCLKSNLLVLK